MTFNENSKLGDLLQNDSAKVVLEKHLPGITTNTMLSMALGFTLKQLSGFPQAELSEAKLMELVDDLKDIK
ncbi:hypothetical protein [Paenibacillus motobuensis]|uniref:Uncharacterized protein n=1 Tax=Paenibacillus motobuensis TaxID=295324 RepID=A0ABN0YLZ4_9BACL